MKKLYVGIDLHSTNSFLGISDEDDQKIYSKRLPFFYKKLQLLFLRF